MAIMALFLAGAAPAAQSAFRVTAVTVIETGMAEPQNAGTDPPDRCKPFRPTQQQVLAWFKLARRVPDPVAMEADRSQCLSRGTLTANGRQYRWVLDQAGLATITVPPSMNNPVFLKGRALPFKIGI